MDDLSSSEIYQFADARTIPDPIFPYTENLNGIPIVIDNGSFQCRVGWATQDEPCLQFRNCYAKHRKDRGKKMPATTELLVGNDISNLEAVRFQLKTAHDENVVSHYQAQELLLNYSFSHLGITDSSGIQHPIVMTEPLLNPQHCRALMSELLFECYNVPCAAYCVDGLANYYHNQEASSSSGLQDGLLVHIGHHTTHVIPILDGGADVAKSRRIKVGGHSLAKFLCRWLQLQYPHQASNITLSRAELAEDEQELERLSELCSAMSEFRQYQPEYQHALEEAGVATIEDLHKKIAAMQIKICKTRAKMAQEPVEEEGRLSPGPGGAGLPEDAEEAEEVLEAMQREWTSLHERRAARRSKRQEMAKRRTAASQERMRLISQLAKREKKDDHFGRRDEDWDVYKAINKEGGGSDSEDELERLQELTATLRQHRPHFLAEGGTQPLTEAQRNQILLTTEMIRTGEVLFQPSLVGLGQGGLADTIAYVLGLFSPADQQRLVDHVVVTGGLATMPGLVDRVRHELRAIRPFMSAFSVRAAQELIQRRMRISVEFQEELALWSSPEHCSSSGLTVQLPFAAAPATAAVDPAVQRERRREAARRLVLINARKREEKVAVNSN
ncbi:actin-related protein 5 [Hyalella azteca]|uniref:Actin-related protein 5 n=1 Tax=Hyalella azteca TaxID=294128 RepID=A0A8B7PEA0_HYAAZ|nr:actin-related protein 5 [Hyalella azteca]